MNRLLNGTLCVTLALGAGLAQAETALRVGLNADIRSTEPGVNRDENTDTVMLHIVEGLVAAAQPGGTTTACKSGSITWPPPNTSAPTR